MTICIAALCQRGQVVVVASDCMVTAGFLALEFEHPGGKIESLSKTCVGLTAGDALLHTELFRACRGMIGILQAPSIDLIAQKVKDQFCELRRNRAEDLVLKPRAMTLEMFYGDGFIRHLPMELSMALDNSIQNAVLPLEIIIAGVDESGGHIYGLSDPGVTNCYDRLFYHAIGSGTTHALLNIISNGHDAKRSVRETVYTVYEAKRRAELAQGVGQATEMGIINAGGIRLVSDEEKKLLDGIYTTKMTPELDKVRQPIEQLPFEEG